MKSTRSPRTTRARQTRFMSRSRYDVLVALADFVQENGYSPSVRELAQVMGRKSHSGIHSHIDGLAHDGFLFRRVGRARSYQLTQDALLLLPRNRRAA